jgi:glycosyltransferase involved in cell wall biosynthesis
MTRTAYTVVIPARNAEAYIGDAVASVLRQQPAPTSVIVVDDASTDTTAAVATGAGAHVLQSGGPVGPGPARNLGVAASATPLVAFLDADDLWAPGHMDACLAVLEDAQVSVAFSATQMFGRVTSAITPELPSGVRLDIRRPLLARNVVPQSGAVVRVDAFRRAGGYNAQYPVAEDYELWMRLATTSSFAYTGLPTSLRRIHEQQLTLKRRNEMIVLSWRVRTEAVARWQAADAGVRAWLGPQMLSAATDDMKTVVWTGDVADLTDLFAVLDAILIGDPPRPLLEDDSVRLGRGSWRRRLLDAECRGRALAGRLLRKGKG